MADISAAAVKALRQRTGLPMMECKRALQETGGAVDAAIDYLRKQGKKTMEGRAGRETSCGRMGVFADVDKGVGALVELQCESAPVAGSDDFIQFATDLATQLATGPGAASVDELLSQSSPGKSGSTLGQQKDDIENRMREVIKINRIRRIDGPCGGYAHHTGTHGVLMEVEGGSQQLANEFCMHVAAMRPTALNTADLAPEVIDKEREILRAAALQEGKPENIVDKMVEGRLRSFYEQCVLTEQPFVKDDKKTVGKTAKEAGMKIAQFVHWELGKDS